MVPKNEKELEEARKRVRERFRSRFKSVANKYRDKLIELYGEEKGRKVKYAEAFEVCEYGSRPSREQLKKMFPSFNEEK